MDLDPLSSHLVDWFTDLNDARKFCVIAGLGGGSSFPEPLSNLEILSWVHLTGNRPTPWEIETLKAMDRRWRVGYGERKSHKSGGTAPAMQHQGVGEYCGGAKVEQCRKMFGALLDRTCATCPN